jgi:hypothetical protein
MEWTIEQVSQLKADAFVKSTVAETLDLLSSGMSHPGCYVSIDR